MKGLKKIAGIAAPIAGFALGGPVGAGIGGALGGAISGKGLEGALTGGLMGYGGGSLFSALGGASGGLGGLSGLLGKSGGLSGALGGSTMAPWGTALSSTGLNFGGASGGGLLGGGGLGGLLGGSSSSFSPLLSGALGMYSNNKAEDQLLKQQQANRELYQPALDNSLFNGGLENDAGYKFNLAEGNKALDRQQSSKGNYFSGEALTEAQKFGQGLADTTYNDAFKRYMSTAGAIQGINDNVGNIGANSTINNGNILSGAGAALLGGQGLSNTGALLNNVGNNVITIAGQRYLRDSSGQLIQIG